MQPRSPSLVNQLVGSIKIWRVTYPFLPIEYSKKTSQAKMLGNPTIIHDFPVFKPILKGFNRLFKIYKCEKKLAGQRSNDMLVGEMLEVSPQTNSLMCFLMNLFDFLITLRRNRADADLHHAGCDFINCTSKIILGCSPRTAFKVTLKLASVRRTRLGLYKVGGFC